MYHPEVTSERDLIAKRKINTTSQLAQQYRHTLNILTIGSNWKAWAQTGKQCVHCSQLMSELQKFEKALITSHYIGDAYSYNVT